jgi:quinol monooxygenase YgiN
MKHKQVVADRAVTGRRQLIKAAGIGAGLALAGGAPEAFAAGAQKKDTACSLVPYFEVAAGKLDDFKALGPRFIKLTRKEPGVLYYAFSFNGQAAHCREGYKDAAAVLAHLGNVDAVLKEALTISKITRLEVHGPAAELDKLREPLAGLNPAWFILSEGGFRV